VRMGGGWKSLRIVSNGRLFSSGVEFWVLITESHIVMTGQSVKCLATSERVYIELCTRVYPKVSGLSR
jgi:hypothetical protein